MQLKRQKNFMSQEKMGSLTLECQGMELGEEGGTLQLMGSSLQYPQLLVKFSMWK